MIQTVFLLAAALCGTRAPALDASAWAKSEWISAPDRRVFDGPIRFNSRSAAGTSWFAARAVNAKALVSAKWMVSGLGVFNVFVNGKLVGEDFLKPGFTQNAKTKYAFTYDVTALMKRGAGEANALAAAVSAGWWRDKICNFFGKKSAFRGVLELTYADGSKDYVGSNTSGWTCGVTGPITQAAIFDGEEYDARIPAPYFGEGLTARPERNEEFKGEVYSSNGAEIVLRHDLAMAPQEAYCWKGVVVGNGKTDLKDKSSVFGKVVKTRVFARGEEFVIPAGETLVVDFGQNAAGVPSFVFKATAGTVLTALPGEMLNEANGERSRGNDGPAGSIYRENLRIPNDGMRAVYTFAGTGWESYRPSYTFFGYRYVSVSATADVTIRTFLSVPVTSIAKGLELGTVETGDACVNRLIKNVYWGQLSNYLSVSTDCPQRNERLGWTADTQVFVEAGSFNADTSRFFHKWMRDMRDSQHEKGSFPGVAPIAQYGNDAMRLGWADAGVIVPYQVWKQFGDTAIVEENWAAMEKYVAHVAETKYQTALIKDECHNYQWADWLSFEKLESAGGAGKPGNSAFDPGPNGKGRVPKADAILYWDYLGGCYWVWDAQMMATMAKAVGKDAAKYEKMAAEAKAYMIGRFFNTPDGMILPVFREMQTPALFALKLGFVTGAAKEATIRGLKANFKANDDCLQTGFLGTSILMDTLTENGMADIAYTLLLNHNFPGWLYSVDQGATTIWERWNSYVKATGFGPVGMNSFNHYAYGAVLAWIYKTAAGIAADPADPGFHTIVMKPVPDRRLGRIAASYKTRYGVVKSAWRYEGAKWIWEFTVPQGAQARVYVPGVADGVVYGAGDHRIEK